MDPLHFILAGTLGVAFAGATILFVRLRRLERRLRDLQQGFEEASTDGPCVREGALRDPLTSLPNRRFFVETIERMLASGRRYGSLVGIVLFDIDDFKRLNEYFGTNQGDLVLRVLAERLKITVREADFPAHLGGDRFGAILTELTRIEDLIVAVQRLNRNLTEPLRIAGEEVLFTISTGICSFPQDGNGATELLNRGEEALQRAKSQGGNNIQLYSETTTRWAHLRMDLQQDLRRAQAGKQLVVHYQPQVLLADGSVVGAEALIRWHHPEQGLLAAGKFIPLAEEIGIMPELGRWLVQEVCRQVAAWKAKGLRAIPISLNLSVRQFQHDNVTEVIRDALFTHQIDPHLLHIELTETIAMDESARVHDVLPELRSLGIKVCLDDFGTGYSSLSYLIRYPVDVLKIDRAFVSEVTKSSLHEAIVLMTLSLAEALQVEVVAEGVEESDQLAFLREHGCHSAQGYLLGRPAPPEELVPMIERGIADFVQLSG